MKQLPSHWKWVTQRYTKTCKQQQLLPEDYLGHQTQLVALGKIRISSLHLPQLPGPPMDKFPGELEGSGLSKTIGFLWKSMTLYWPDKYHHQERVSERHIAVLEFLYRILCSWAWWCTCVSSVLVCVYLIKIYFFEIRSHYLIHTGLGHSPPV